ncbi:hypothetical protein [Myceligenerans crystallogenes]|uniref:Peptidase C39-like domain-containing protein n=1 Tax=Myceligenerans crystallogenes TaxID=316335 RepID=A0ABN2NDH1_9MICO
MGQEPWGLNEALAARLSRLPERDVRRVLGLGLPAIARGAAAVALRLPDGALVSQKTGTTCGAAVLLMLAAQREPELAWFLSTGERIEGRVPEFLLGARIGTRGTTTHGGAPAGARAGAGASGPTDRRLAAVQVAVRRRTNRWTFWPGVFFGSAPWGYVREVRRVTGRPVEAVYSALGPLGPDRLDVVDRAVAAVDRGVLVPFLAGPSAGQSRARLPRHYVLLVGHDGDTLRFYEPASGEVRRVPLTAVRGGDVGGNDVFGGWGAVYGVFLPEA